MLNGEIDDNLASIVYAQMLHLESEAPDKPISLYINSPGGNVTAGMSAMIFVMLSLTISHRTFYLRHDAVRPLPYNYDLHGPGLLHGISHTGRGLTRPAILPSALVNNDTPTIGRI